MFEDEMPKTLFVLGAGASCGYGYPTGLELRNKILSLDPADGILEQGGLLDFQVRKFQDDYRKSSHTIDFFVGQKPEHLNVARYIVALLLIRHEKLEKVHDTGWYQWLYQFLTRDYDRQFSTLENRLRNIRFITFNYDISLDQFLFDVIRQAHPNVPLNQLKALFDDIGPHHVFGKIGSWPWEENRQRVLMNRDYFSATDGRNGRDVAMAVRSIGSQIRFVHEGTATSFYLNQDEFHKIVFLGFGFHSQNLSIVFGPKGAQANKFMMKGQSLYSTKVKLGAALEHEIGNQTFFDAYFEFVGSSSGNGDEDANLHLLKERAHLLF